MYLHMERYYVGNASDMLLTLQMIVQSPHAQAGRGNAPDFIAAIERIHTNKDGEVFVDGRWYYRPEETAEGRKPWYRLLQ